MSSWFYKLRRRTGGAIAGGEPDIDDGFGKQPVAPAPSPCSPNRASYYVPSRERVAPPRADNPKLRDTQFPRSPQASDIVFDVVATTRRDADQFKPMPELKLRPILTRPAGVAADDSSSAAASPTARVRRPRFHATRPAAEEEDEACSARRRRRKRSACSRVRSWMCESVVVVKESAEPEEDFLESMAEMIAASDGVRSPRGLEDLLACYLALNAPDHHRAIVAAFRRAWLHLHTMPLPAAAPSKGRCMHEARLD
ncbi:unnamed protein product [Urochloa humidicola]